ncbi:hypothetical protein VTI74DRAFT_4961 [Chaetomium olivicolor]
MVATLLHEVLEASAAGAGSRARPSDLAAEWWCSGHELLLLELAGRSDGEGGFGEARQDRGDAGALNF